MDGLFIVYKKKTGRIYQVMTGPDTKERRKTINQSLGFINNKFPPARQCAVVFFKGKDITAETHYLEDGVPKVKKAFPHIGVGNGTLYNLPRDTMVYWPDGETSVPSDGSVEFDSNVTLKLTLYLYHAKYVRKKIEVEYAI